MLESVLEHSSSFVPADCGETRGGRILESTRKKKRVERYHKLTLTQIGRELGVVVGRDAFVARWSFKGRVGRGVGVAVGVGVDAFGKTTVTFLRGQFRGVGYVLSGIV